MLTQSEAIFGPELITVLSSAYVVSSTFAGGGGFLLCKSQKGLMKGLPLGALPASFSYTLIVLLRSRQMFGAL